MNTISGKIVLKESGVGVPDLLVVVFDLDPRTTPEEVVGALSGALTTHEPRPAIAADSLGSVATTGSGEFTLTYADQEFQVRNPEEQRPDLLLAVLAPEEPGREFASRVLFTSAVRQNAGRTETYIIRLTAGQLEAAAVPVPAHPDLGAEGAESVVSKVAQFARRNVAITENVRALAQRQVEAERALSDEIEREFVPRLMTSLTGVPAELEERLNFVPPNADRRAIETVTWRTINRDIESTVNTQAPAAGYVTLTEDQAARFKDAAGDFRSDIPASEIEPLLHGAAPEGPRPSFLLREEPAAALCRHETLPAPLQDGVPGDDGGPDGGGDADGGAPDGPVGETESPVPGYLDRLMRDMVSPDDILGFGTRPTLEEIQQQVDSVRLSGGPADVPAYYDFHTLQIAFEHVWQQMIDEGVLETAEALYREVAEMGGDPRAAVVNGGDPLRALRAEWKNAAYARAATHVPVALARIREGEEGPTGPSGGGPSAGGGITRPPGLSVHDVIADGGRLVADPGPRRPRNLLEQLEDRLKTRDYAFTVYAPNSINFGLMVTYRQKWVPVTFQVGPPIATIPLAPKEVRKVVKKIVTKKRRAIKEVENNLRVRKEDAGETMRAEAEVVQRAEAKTNFSLTAQGGFNLGIAKGDSTTSLGRDAGTASNEVKKSFREAVRNAAQEYKDERRIEIETVEEAEFEQTETGELRNDNEELTLTLVYYELQRRYRVSEQIHRVTPVVLVALQVPRPDQLTLGWLAEHDWILNRVLLDDSLRAPLTYLRRIVGDERALTQQRQHVEKLEALVTALQEDLVAVRETVGRRYAALEREIERRAEMAGEASSEGIFEKGYEWLVGSDEEESPEAARIREDAARDAHEQAAKEEKELRSRLEREVTALQVAVDGYTRAWSEHLNHMTDVARLRVHVMQNILHYMQAVWNHTHPDQLFFQLHAVKAPRLIPRVKTYTLAPVDEVPASVVLQPDQQAYAVTLNLELEPSPDPADDFATLAELADLDNPLGFKGNYLILPLKQSNALTDFMMMPYIDDELGLHDPDETGNWTLTELADYARCLQASLPEADFQAIKDPLRRQYKQLLTARRRLEEDIILPTPNASLYVEALPGKHAVLEDFKLFHRALDVARAREEVRAIQLNSTRVMARLLADNLEDPDIEAKYVFEGDGTATIVPPGEPGGGGAEE